MVHCKLRAARWLDLFLFFVGVYRQYKVSGDSMFPLLKDGNRVLAGHSNSLEEGNIVVLKHPFQDRMIVKSIHSIADNLFFVSGIHNSSDSSSFGLVKRSSIVGVVKCKF